MFEAWDISFFSIILLLTGGFAIAVCLFAWNRGDTTGSFTLSLLMIAVAQWALASSMESAAIEIQQKFIWAQISHLGIHSIPPLFLVLTFQYNQNERWLVPRRVLLLWLVPLITMGLAFTNSFHNLIWTEFTSNPDHPTQIIFKYGAGFWVGAIYDYALILIASWNIVWTAQSFSNLYRRQVGAIVIAAALPWIGNILYISGINPFPGQGLTSITFLLMGIFLAWSMFRHQLFDFTPIARETIVDKLIEVVIYVDKNLKIADLNPQARLLVQIDGNVIGHQATEVLSRWSYLATIFQNKPDNVTVRRNIQDQEGNWYDLRISPLKQQDRTQGWLIILRDITEQKDLETALRTSEELYRNVTEKANDGIAILQHYKIVYCNPQLATLIGYYVDEMIGESFLQYIASDHLDTVRERHNRRMKGQDEPTRYESILIHSSGNHVPVEFNVNIMKHDGKPALLAIVRDITAQVNAEKILLEHVRDQKHLNEITMAAMETSELSDTLQTLPSPKDLDAETNRKLWEMWQEGLSLPISLPEKLPPLRMLLIWDNLRGHYTTDLLLWLFEHGVMPLYTPLGGSWLNMAESIQRILFQRGLAGQSPESPMEIINSLEAVADFWNQNPTPFEWGGKRAARRQRSRQRKHALGGSGAYTRHPVHRKSTVFHEWLRSCQTSH